MIGKFDIDDVPPRRRRALLAEMLRQRALGRRVRCALPSVAQQRMWFVNEMAPQGAAYNISAALKINGPLRPAVLRQALRSLAIRHEALRTTVACVDGEPIQFVYEEPLSELELVELPAELSEEDLRAELRARSAMPFDLEKGPILRCALFSWSPDRHVFFFACHHIVFDGWSMSIFVRDLKHFYDRHAEGGDPAVEALPVQYSDYAAWQRRRLDDDELVRQLNYWRSKLAGAAPTIDLPSDRPRPRMPTYRGSRFGVLLPSELKDQVTALARREGVTPFMVFLTAFKVLLLRYTGQTDLCVGSPVANRTRSELDGVIGLFVNTLVLRTELCGDMRFSEALLAVRETCLEAYANQEVPFEKLVETLRPPRDPSRNPLFQVMLVYVPFAGFAAPKGLAAEPFDYERDGAQLDLTLHLVETSAGLQCVFEYSTELFDRARIDRLAQHFYALLEAAVARPDCALTALPAPGPAEREELTL